MSINNQPYSYDFKAAAMKRLPRTNVYYRSYTTDPKSKYKIQGSSKGLSIIKPGDSNFVYKLEKGHTGTPVISDHTLLVRKRGSYDIHNLLQQKKLLTIKTNSQILEARILNNKIFTVQMEYKRVNNRSIRVNNLMSYDMNGKMIAKQKISESQTYNSRVKMLKTMTNKVMITSDQQGIRAWINDDQN